MGPCPDCARWQAKAIVPQAASVRHFVWHVAACPADSLPGSSWHSHMAAAHLNGLAALLLRLLQLLAQACGLVLRRSKRVLR